MVALSLGRRRSVTIASFIVAATLGLSAQAAIDCEGSECGEIIMLEDFASPKHDWVEMNDPVMGGKSTGTFTLDDTNHVGVFDGSVEIVSFLKAPGFIKAETKKGESWPDVSSCEGFRFTLKSSTPSYKGFRVSFGNKRPKGAFPYSYGFKTDLHLDDTTDFQTVKLPFNMFTDKWDAGTGDAVVTCAENKEYCPQEEDKKSLYSIAVWGEGVEGKVDLEIQSVAAYGCKGSGAMEGNNVDRIKETEEEEEVSVAGSDSIVIEDFANPSHKWKTMNDPVMGGKSDSSVSVSDGIAKFEGTCAIVPFLHAPGFITMMTGTRRGSYFTKSGSNSPSFPDVSGCKGMEVSLRTSVDYEGYYVSFGTDVAPGGRYAMGYKTHLDLGVSEDFVDIQLPFSDFSSKWDDATGKTEVTCKEDPKYCPSLDNLRDMKTISFWGEGVEGTVALDVKYIGAYGCASASTLGAASASLASVPSQSDTSTNTSAMLVVAVCSTVVAGLVLARRFRRGQQRSPEYEEVVMINNVGLVV